MRAIFISYRRDDAEGEAGRLFADLADVFGERSVFMDVAAIEVGRDFRKAIDDSVATCGVLLAVIGREWVDARNEAGQRRLEDPSDFVRLESASALKRDIPVVPVLVRGAKMPRPEQLPDDLRELAYRNGVELTHARWNSDLQLLIKALRPHVQDSRTAISKANLNAALATASAAGAASSKKASEVWAKAAPALRKIPRKILFAAAGVILLLIIVASVLASRRVTVPSLGGQSLSDATAKLAEDDLKVGQITHVPRTDVARDTVVGEHPAAQGKVKPGSKVDLIVSDLPQPEAPPLPEITRNNTPLSPSIRYYRAPSSNSIRSSAAQPNTTTQPSTTAPSNTTPANTAPAQNQAAAAPSQPAAQVVNINGFWHDNRGVRFQVLQHGSSYTYTATSAVGFSRGSGTISGLAFVCSYNTALINGVRSSGRCTGTISANGKVIRSSCWDSVGGPSSDVLIR